MKGFISCNKINNNLISSKFNKYKMWDLMRKANLQPYPELDIYVNPQFGAWMGNIDTPVDNLIDLWNLNQIDFDTYDVVPYSNYISNGYDLIIGPAVPDSDGLIHGKGIYCRNWTTILKNELTRFKENTKIYVYN